MESLKELKNTFFPKKTDESRDYKNLYAIV